MPRFFRPAPLLLPRSWRCLLLFALALVPSLTLAPRSVAQSGPVIADAGFETPSAGPSGNYNSFLIAPTGAPWTFSGVGGNGSGITANGSGFTNSNPNAPEGVQAGYLQNQGTISQAISGFQASISYRFAFSAAQRGSGNQGGQDFQVYLDNTLIGSYRPAGTSYTDLYTNAVVPGAGTHTLSFVGQNSAGGDNTAFIDNVRVTPPFVVNAGFETPSVSGTSGGYAFNPANAGWTFSGVGGNGSGVTSNGSGFTNSNPNAPEGTQVGFLQINGTFSQSLSGWLSGTSYSLRFSAAQRANYGVQSFQVLLDGTVLRTITPASTTYTEYTIAPFTTTAGTHTLTFTGTDPNGGDNTAFIDNVRLSAINAPVADIPPPGWAMDAVPTDSGSEADGAGPGSSMQVSLPSGVEENTPGPDLGAYNPVGPSVSYERMYRSTLAAQGYGSPGLSPGWVDNYDLRVLPGSGSYRLLYPNGAQEPWGGTTGSLSTPSGAPYLANAPTSGTLTMTMKDRSVFTFTQVNTISANYPAGAYLLSKMTNLVGHSVTLNRDTAANNYRVLSITNDAASPVTLLKFNYGGATLSSVEDLASSTASEHRQVGYAFTGGSLSSVTQVAADGGTASDLWRYQYQTINNEPFLNSITTPDPMDGSYSFPASVTYDQTGFVTAHTDANNRLRTFGFGPSGVQLQAFNHAGDTSPVQQWLQNFGPNNVDTGFVDAASHSSSVSYTGTPSPYLPGTVTNRNSQKTSITYDPANNYGNVATVTDNRRTQITSQYQYPADFALGQVSSMQESHILTNGTTDSTKQPTTLDYYGTADGVINGLLHDVYSPAPDTINASNTVTTTYNYLVVNGASLGNVASIIMPGNNAISVLTTTLNYTTDGTYSALEALGEPLTVTDPAGDVTHYRYDGRGNRIAMLDASGNETDFAFNIADQLVQITEPITNQSGSGHAHTVYTYQYPGGSLQSVAVYDEGNTVGPVRQVNYAYGHEGEVLSVTGSTEPVSYSYDGRYRVTMQSDGNGHSTFFDFDPIGSLIAERYPNNSGGTSDKTTFGYDADQNMITRIDGRGVTATYTRSDPESMITQVAYSNLPAVVQPIAPVLLAYDNYGRRQSMSDGTGTKTYGYDDLDELLSVTTSFTNGPQNQALAYTHYFDGSRKSLTLPANVSKPLTVNAGRFSYLYDAAQRLTQATFPWSGPSGKPGVEGQWFYRYQANGWLNRVTDGSATPSQSSLLTTYAYNARGFLLSLTNFLPDPQNGGINTTSSSFTGMTYDAVGNRLKVSVNQPTAFGINGGSAGQRYLVDASRRIAYGYDTANSDPSLNRDVLTNETSTYTGADNGKTHDQYHETYADPFGYDTAYNPTLFRGASVSYNSDNQFTLGGFSYDGAGNPILYPSQATGQSATFTFDPEARLTGISSPAFAATYDGDGLRATKTAAGVTTYFLYDGSTPVAEENFDGTNATFRNLNGWGADGWRSRYTGNQVFNYTFDAQGNLAQRQLVGDIDALAQDSATYSAYGALGGDLNTSANPYTRRDPVGYGGQWGNYTDPETNLLCLTHRYYDTGTGRFINRDPIDYAGGVNLYGYAGNNPINEMDPNGTDSLWQRMGRALGRKLFGTTRSDVARIGRARGDEGLSAEEMAEGGLKPLDVHPAQSARVLVQGERQVAQTVAENAIGGIGGPEEAEANVAATQLRLLKKYGKGGFRELADGRRRYYGVLKPATTAGEMAGLRKVREWNPATDKMRTWFETIDHAGNVRQVRPETGGEKVHYQFDEHGRYTGKW